MADDVLRPRIIELVSRLGQADAHPDIRERFIVRHGLTDTEFVVLDGLAAGLDAVEIASSRGIAVTTVRTHFARLRDKFGVKRTSQVMRLALIEGLGRD